jgi:murein DD-endopeptidase MepM/ murein hydrolase activator NlpD
MPAFEPFPGTAFFHVGQHSPIITAMGKRLVAEGCGKYQSGPGPDWSDTDRRSYAAWQEKLGHKGGNADGIPGKDSWDRLHVPATGAGGGHGHGHGHVASPVPGHGVTTPYGKKGPLWRLGHHTGADYAAPTGTPCVAVLDGSVRSGEDTAFGHYLVLRSNGFDYWYCHLSHRDVSAGAVRAGDAIGKVGHSGHVTGSHLHFEKRPVGGHFGSDLQPTW